MNPQLRVLYIEGFSPGPGLPSPLLTQAGAEWHVARMPYGMGDIIKNPYVLAIVGSVVACIWAVTILSGDIYVVLIIIFALAVCIVLLKRAAVGYVLDRCIQTYSKRVNELRPDVVIGYSWGGGVLVGMLNRSLWDGASIIIAPAGEQMWKHAGRAPPTLRRGSIPGTASVITIQGDRDPIVSLEETQRLHKGADEAAVELLVVAHGDHFLRRTVTPNALVDWFQRLCDRTARRRGLGGG